MLRPSRTHYLLSVTVAFLSAALGGAIVGGGDGRFIASSFAAARSVAGPTLWGVLLLLAGLMLCFGVALDRIKLRRVSLALIAAWALFFAGTIGFSAANDAHAPWTGVFAYSWIGVSAIILARTDVGQIKSQP